MVEYGSIISGSYEWIFWATDGCEATSAKMSTAKPVRFRKVRRKPANDWFRETICAWLSRTLRPGEARRLKVRPAIYRE